MEARDLRIAPDSLKARLPAPPPPSSPEHLGASRPLPPSPVAVKLPPPLSGLQAGAPGAPMIDPGVTLGPKLALETEECNIPEGPVSTEFGFHSAPSSPQPFRSPSNDQSPLLEDVSMSSPRAPRLMRSPTGSNDSSSSIIRSPVVKPGMIPPPPPSPTYLAVLRPPPTSPLPVRIPPPPSSPVASIELETSLASSRTPFAEESQTPTAEIDASADTKENNTAITPLSAVLQSIRAGHTPSAAVRRLEYPDAPDSCREMEPDSSVSKPTENPLEQDTTLQTPKPALGTRTSASTARSAGTVEDEPSEARVKQTAPTSMSSVLQALQEAKARAAKTSNVLPALSIPVPEVQPTPAPETSGTKERPKDNSNQQTDSLDEEMSISPVTASDVSLEEDSPKSVVLPLTPSAHNQDRNRDFCNVAIPKRKSLRGRESLPQINHDAGNARGSPKAQSKAGKSTDAEGGEHEKSSTSVATANGVDPSQSGSVSLNSSPTVPQADGVTKQEEVQTAVNKPVKMVSEAANADSTSLRMPLATRATPPSQKPDRSAHSSQGPPGHCDRCEELRVQIRSLRETTVSLGESASAATEEAGLLRDALARAREGMQRDDKLRAENERLLDVVYTLKAELDRQPLGPDILRELQTVKEKLVYMTLERDELAKEVSDMRAMSIKREQSRRRSIFG